MFLARGLARRFTSRVTTHPIVNWPFSFRKADRLLIAPQDLRTADATRASEIYAGRFVFAGKVVICDARSPFEVGAAVRGMGGRAARLRLAAAPARRRIPASPAPMRARWSTSGSRVNSARDPVAWRPDVVARRVISWLSQAPLVLDDSDVRFYRRFLRSLTRQVRHLRHTVSDARDGVPRLQATIALTYAALCMANQQRHIRAATKRLGDELAAPDPARRRACQPQSRRPDRASGRPAAAADRIHAPATSRRRRRCSTPSTA